MFKTKSRDHAPAPNRFESLAARALAGWVTEADLRKHGVDLADPPDARFGAARAVYKLCKPRVSQDERSSLKHRIYRDFQVPSQLVNKRRARKAAAAKLPCVEGRLAQLEADRSALEARFEAKHSDLEKAHQAKVNAFAKFMEGEQAGLSAERDSLQAEREGVARDQAALAERAAKIGALLQDAPQAIRVELGGDSCHIPLEAIRKYPDSVLAGLCEQLTAPVLTLPRNTPLNRGTLQHIANFYQGHTEAFYSVSESRLLRTAADYMGLPEFAEHVQGHTDAPGSALVDTVRGELAECRATLRVLQEALVPANGWKYATQGGHSKVGTVELEPVGLNISDKWSGQVTLLLREPNR